MPDWVFDLATDGYISSSEMVFWMAVRRYAPDQDRSSFSPPPVDVTNREIAEIMQATTRRVQQVLKSLTEKGLIKKIPPEEAEQRELEKHRYLQLANPRNEFHPKSVSGETGFTPNRLGGKAAEAKRVAERARSKKVGGKSGQTTRK